MPSFDSLRGPRRRSAVDLLVPGQPPAPEPPAPQQTDPEQTAPEQTAPPRRVAPRRPAPPRPPAAPRPAEWGDLLHLGVRLARSAAELPVRLARWSLREPGRCLRRLRGD